MRINLMTKSILISEFPLSGLILLYLQFRWLPMECNIVYNRWNVGFTTSVMDAMLQVRYAAMK
jgi:hypothetical protein